MVDNKVLPTFAAIAKKYNVDPKTITNIIQDRVSILALAAKLSAQQLATRKRTTASRLPEVDEILETWFHMVRERGLPVDGVTLKSKADFIRKALLKKTKKFAEEERERTTTCSLDPEEQRALDKKIATLTNFRVCARYIPAFVSSACACVGE